MSNAENNKADYTISGRKVLWTVLSALVVGAVGGIYATASIINNDHFTVLSHSTRISALEETSVKKEVYQIQYQYIIDALDKINDKLDKKL